MQLTSAPDDITTEGDVVVSLFHATVSKLLHCYQLYWHRQKCTVQGCKVFLFHHSLFSEDITSMMQTPGKTQKQKGQAAVHKDVPKETGKALGQCDESKKQPKLLRVRRWHIVAWLGQSLYLNLTELHSTGRETSHQADRSCSEDLEEHLQGHYKATPSKVISTKHHQWFHLTAHWLLNTYCLGIVC